MFNPRWIKYEEDLLDGADRWGRAHIASLSFHSVINLRLALENSKGLSVYDVTHLDSLPPPYVMSDYFLPMAVCTK